MWNTFLLQCIFNVCHMPNMLQEWTNTMPKSWLWVSLRLLFWFWVNNTMLTIAHGFSHAAIGFYWFSLGFLWFLIGFYWFLLDLSAFWLHFIDFAERSNKNQSETKKTLGKPKKPNISRSGDIGAGWLSGHPASQGCSASQAWPAGQPSQPASSNVSRPWNICFFLFS